MCGHLGRFHLLVIVNHATVNVGVQITLEILPSLLLEVYPVVGLQITVALFLIFHGAPIIFKTVSETAIYSSFILFPLPQPWNQLLLRGAIVLFLKE